jgi:hypothetical protein
VHANRAHLAAREEGPDLGIAIAHSGKIGRRVATLQRGHAENEGGRARVVSGTGDAHDDGAANGRAARRRRRATDDGAGNLGPGAL